MKGSKLEIGTDHKEEDTLEGDLGETAMVMERYGIWVLREVET